MDRPLLRRALLLVGAAALAWPSISNACQQWGPGVWVRAPFPASDRLLPSNGQVVVSYSSVDAPGKEIPAFGPDLVLLDDAGGTVEIRYETRHRGFIDDVFVDPVLPLAPGTYQLADRHVVSCDHWQTSCALLDAPSAFASFAVTPAADTSPPLFEGLAAVTTERARCLGDGCCGPYDVAITKFSWAPGSDDVAGTDIAYNLYRRSSDAPEGLVFVYGPIVGTYAFGFFACGASTKFQKPLLQPGAYLVRAVDWAGNEDTNVRELYVPNGCDSPDGGVDDASRDDAALARRSGCQVASGDGPSRAAWPLILLGGLGAAARASHRRSRRSPSGS